MKRVSLELPAMYGDHHVIVVRQMLSELDGVQEVYASSCFQIVQVTYTPEEINEEVIVSTLDEAGYLGEINVPAEVGVINENTDTDRYFRHTSIHRQTNQTIGFTQEVPYASRPLWPCPGIGPVRSGNGEG